MILETGLWVFLCYSWSRFVVENMGGIRMVWVSWGGENCMGS